MIFKYCFNTNKYVKKIKLDKILFTFFMNSFDMFFEMPNMPKNLLADIILVVNIFTNNVHMNFVDLNIFHGQNDLRSMVPFAANITSLPMISITKGSSS